MIYYKNRATRGVKYGSAIVPARGQNHGDPPVGVTSSRGLSQAKLAQLDDHQAVSVCPGKSQELFSPPLVATLLGKLLPVHCVLVQKQGLELPAGVPHVFALSISQYFRAR